jgi:NDP-sugar pyrophosphorylase family protein
MKAMIFAAGMGTRLRPITDAKPKALVEINGVTLLEINIRNLIKYGFRDIVVNVHHFSNQVRDFLKINDNFGINIEVSDETDLLLDTGGGLKKAATLLAGKDPILVHNVDIISDIDLGEIYLSHQNANFIATLACMERESSRRFLANKQGLLCGWQNRKTGETKISRLQEINLKPISFCGIHVISPIFLDLIEEEGVFSVIDVYLRLAKAYPIFIKEITTKSWFDVGSIEVLEKLNKKGN